MGTGDKVTLSRSDLPSADCSYFLDPAYTLCDLSHLCNTIYTRKLLGYVVSLLPLPTVVALQLLLNTAIVRFAGFWNDLIVILT
jgi:hypothetical protein